MIQQRAPLFQLDWALLVTPLLLTATGVLLVFSASFPQGLANGIASSPAFRHGANALAGVLIMLLVARLDYRVFRTFAVHIFIGALLLLGVVDLVGQSVGGVKRWIDLGFFQVQPSEMAKFATVVILARLFADFKQHITGIRVFVFSILVVLVPCGLVFLQPDLGTAVVFIAIWFGMCIMAGVRPVYLIGLVAMAAVSMPLTFYLVLKEYQRERFHTFLDPSVDPLGAGYNILQSEISVGSGGLLGKGLLNGTQSQLHFLRVQQTDFIFSVLGEELGFVGALAVFALFMLMLWRGLEAAQRAQDDFGRLLATGVVVMVLTQVFINIGVNIRLLPVTGIPLPFLSFGGSSLLTMFFAMGVLQAVYRKRRKPDW